MGHLHHRLFIAWRRREGSAHRVQESHQVRPFPPPPARTLRLRAYPCALLCSIIFCEAVAIYGVIVSIILQTKMEKPDLSKPLEELTANHFYDMASGYALFWAGVCCGFGNLACGSAATPPAARPPPVEARHGAGALDGRIARALSTCARVPSAGCASASAAAAARWRTRRRVSSS